MLASKGNCVVSERLPGQLSGNLDTVCLVGWLKTDFWQRGRQGPTASFENQDQVDQASCKPRERKPSPDHGSQRGVKIAFGSPSWQGY